MSKNKPCHPGVYVEGSPVEINNTNEEQPYVYTDEFEDGSFCILTGGEYYETPFIKVETDFAYLDHHDLLEMDIITKEECQAREDAQKSKWDEEDRTRRLAQYEKLKKEFEPE